MIQAVATAENTPSLTRGSGQVPRLPLGGVYTEPFDFAQDKLSEVLGVRSLR
jgi:hypothetical protein